MLTLDQGRLSTHTCLWRFSGPLTGVLCKPPFAEFVEKNRIRCKRSLQDFYQRREQNCSRPAAFKDATVRERPLADLRAARKQTSNSPGNRAAPPMYAKEKLRTGASRSQPV
jgi:hypothetical protein